MKGKGTTGCDLLVFAPHPDDAELFCGGTILRAVSSGRKVVLVDLSRGELSSRGDLETRAQETEAATRILGVASRENLDLPDGNIGLGSSVVDHRKHIVSAIRRHRPEIILAPYWEERHPDHVRTSRLVMESVFFAGVEKFLVDQKLALHAPRALYFYQLRHTFEPTVVVDVSDVHEKKMQAIACYRTQLGLDAASGTQTLLSSPLTVSSIAARDGYYGARIGVKFGEPLIARAVAGTRDVVEFARSANSRPALFFS